MELIINESIFGYKSFSLDRRNIYGIVFEEGKKYHVDGDIKFGPQGNGYHFAERFEDTIRYSGYSSDSILRDVSIAEVIGSGKIVKSEDFYNEYFDMYSVSDLEIIKFLSREEIISLALNLPEMRMKRFVSLFRLNDDEIELFLGKSIIVDSEINYYQLKKK